MQKMKIHVCFGAIIFFLTLFCFENAFAQEKMTERQKVWQELLTFLDKDLSNAEKELKEKADVLLDKLIPERVGGNGKQTFRSMTHSLRITKKISTPKGEKRIALLETQNFIILPGQQRHFIHLFSENGRLLGTTDFITGWRMISSDFSIAENKELGCYLLQLKSAGNGYSSKQYYALLSDSAVLVRLEISSSQTEENNRNAYGCKYPFIGAPVNQLTINERISLLNSHDKIEVLQALMWFSGRHYTILHLQQEDEDMRKIAAKNPDVTFPSTLQACPESVDDAKIFAEAQNRDDIKKILKRLSESENEWIRQTAELALKPINRRW